MAQPEPMLTIKPTQYCLAPSGPARGSTSSLGKWPAFPSNIPYSQSGKEQDNMHWLDRVLKKQTNKQKTKKPATHTTIKCHISSTVCHMKNILGKKNLYYLLVTNLPSSVCCLFTMKYMSDLIVAPCNLKIKHWNVFWIHQSQDLFLNTVEYIVFLSL